MNKYVLLSVDDLYHHPGNPRKDLGDLTELSESIAKQGVMQNLTVIPMEYWDRPGEVKPSVKERVAEIEDGEPNEHLLFYVLIGNRRYEAALMAGVEEVPCHIVTDLSREEQVAIMLEENMQRNDLTPIEQAHGFQMMLDFGDSVQGIKEKTGFSETTIYHRLNLNKLDPEILKEAVEGRQLTLTELTELERVKSIETRNKILKGSGNIKAEVENAVIKEQRDEANKAFLSKLREHYLCEEFPKDARTWDSCWQRQAYFTSPEDFSTDGLPDERLYYKYDQWTFIIYTRKDDEETDDVDTDEEKAERMAEERKKAENKKRLDTLFKAFLIEINRQVVDFVQSSIGIPASIDDFVLSKELYLKRLEEGIEGDLEVMCQVLSESGVTETPEEAEIYLRDVNLPELILLEWYVEIENRYQSHTPVAWNGCYHRQNGETWLRFINTFREFLVIDDEYMILLKGELDEYEKE